MSLTFKRKVLVLNKLWVACSIVTLRRALSLLCKDSAFIIDHQFQTYSWNDWEQLRPQEDEECITTTRTSFKIPNVILLRDYDKMPSQRLNFNRKALYRRDGSMCLYCGEQLAQDEWTIDHVLPKSQGGKTTWENCVVSCQNCNSTKANRTLEQAGLKFCKKDYKPSKPKFALFKSDVREKSWDYFLND